ncbi:MAG: GNAT family N-acetyltransferase [Rhodobiaceae bacterium]|nr:GNAT family N-acetyltransferase [Rhodobiaceae bacterium]
MSVVMETAAGIALVRDDGVADAETYSVSRCGAGATAGKIWDKLFETGSASPYQGRSFVQAHIDALAAAMGVTPHILLVRDGAGETVMLVPLGVRRTGPVTVAEFLGGKEANYLMPILAPHFSRTVSARTLRELLVECGRLTGADLLSLRNVPESWDGEIFPLAKLKHQLSPSFAYHANLKQDPEATLEALRSSSGRKRIRRYEKRLQQEGEVALRRAATVEEALTLFDTYLAQKQQRMRDQRIGNVFEQPKVQAFYRTLIEREAGQPDGIADFYWLQVGDNVAATWFGIHHGGRWSGMITSFDAEKFGTLHAAEILIKKMVEDLSIRGFKVLDLGIGEARYKNDWCDGTDRLIDIFLACGPMGHFAAPALSAAYAVKRIVKQNPKLKSLAMRVTATSAG